jgi:Pyruvate/2-oxoacid:ferredoxin oxidoreductase delta subunit
MRSTDMSNESYHKLAKVLDTLPNGFPSTEDGLEISLLKRIFTPEEAELYCDLRLSFETADQIAERTGRPREGLEEQLVTMWKEKGEIQGVELGGTKVFRMLPWAIGIYEMQLPRLDRELAQLCNEYNSTFTPQFLDQKPQLMRTIPVGEEVAPAQRMLGYDQVSGVIEAGQTFLLNECICKKEEHLLDNGCDHPLEVCLAVGPVPGIFDDAPSGRVISKEEAYEVLQTSEDAGLVHLTSNVANGHYFICNCCGCCCGVLKGITKHGLAGVINSDFYSEIDAEECTECGLCAKNVCQVDAISEQEDGHRIDRTRCLGCGNCILLCPTDAIRLVRKPPEEQLPPPADNDAWLAERGRLRGIDYSPFK